jgi:hypothetical protein
MTLDLNRLSAILRQLVAVAGIVVSCTDSLHLPGGVRAAIVGTSGFLLSVEHYVAGASTPANPTQEA